MSKEVHKECVVWRLVSSTTSISQNMKIEYFEKDGLCYIQIIECSLDLQKYYSGYDFKAALIKLRGQVEALDYIIACNGCLRNIKYSGQLLRRFKGLRAYVVTDFNNPVDISSMINVFDPVDNKLLEQVVTIKEQEAYSNAYVDNAIKNSKRWAFEGKKKRKYILENNSLFKKTNNDGKR